MSNRSILIATALLLANNLSAQEEQPQELAPFHAEQTSLEDSNALSPLNRPVNNVFMDDMTVMEIPRSVTVLTPEAMKQYNLRSFDDLPKAGAGLQRPNYFGLAGTPFIRGTQAGVFFNGMKRTHNRNDAPMSFGSLEAMNIVKGPAPVHFGPTSTGGYVDFLPKSPYYDQFRGSVTATIGSWEHYNLQLDVGGPTELFGNPAAWRASITGQDDGTYYNNLRNDYYSVYLALRSQISEDTDVFAGFEFFNHDTNENVGWNRISQDLIDNGRYIVGSIDPNNTSALYNNTADLSQIDGFFDDQQAAANNVDDRPNLALVIPAPQFNAAGLNPADFDSFVHSGQTYYRYKKGYTGPILKETIDGNEVLADPNDYAQSNSLLGFSEIRHESNPDMPITNKSIIEYKESDKLSSYGYATKVRNFEIANRIEVDRKEFFNEMPMNLKFGAEARFGYSWFMEDFSKEPFNRRDISDGIIEPQSIVYAGPQLNWTAGHAAESTIVQTGLFALGNIEATDKLTVMLGGRLENAWFDYGLPEEWNGPRSPGDFDAHDTHFGNWSVAPVYELTDNINLYAAVQGGTTETPSDHGTYQRGASNFNKAELYEAGIKSNFFDGKLYAHAAVFYWDKSNNATTPGGSETRHQRAKGVEVEMTAQPVKGLTIMGSFSAQKVFTRKSLPFRTRYLTDQEIALYSGAIQYGADDALVNANNPDWEAPGFPQVTANLFAVYEFQNGFGFGAGPSWSDTHYANYEHTLRYPSVTIWNANVFYRNDRVEVFLRLNNLTDERWFRGNDGSFASNTITTAGEPFGAKLSITVKF